MIFLPRSHNCLGQGNPKGAVSGCVVQVSGVLSTVNGRFDELLVLF